MLCSQPAGVIARSPGALAGFTRGPKGIRSWCVDTNGGTTPNDVAPKLSSNRLQQTVMR